MKKINLSSFLLLAIFACQPSLLAQVQMQGGIVEQGRSIIKLAKRMTFFAGPSSVTLRGNTDNDNGRQFKLGYAAGVGIEEPIIKNLQVSFKLLYERKGDEHTDDIAFDPELQTYIYYPVQWETVLDYLVLPVMLESKFGKKTQYYFGGGVYAGYLLNHKLKYTELSSGYTQTNSIIENYQRLDFGASLALGVKIPLGRSFLSIQAEDHLGLVNIGDYVMDGVLKTNSLILLMGFTLPKKYP